jgi:hypothetical protein
VIQGGLLTRPLNLRSGWFGRPRSELKAISEALWDLEDEYRACDSASESGPRIVELARAVYQNNDRRAAVKRRINERLGSEIRREVLQRNRFRAHRLNYRLDIHDPASTASSAS